MERLCCALILVLASPALLLAGGWSSIGSDHRELEGYAIVAVGELSGKRHFDFKSSQTLEWFEFSETYGDTMCITFLGVEPIVSGEEAALIVVDERESVRLALIESSVGNIKISLEAIAVIGCPAIS